MADKIRVGLIYYSAGQTVDVEAGHNVIGRTTRDPKIGEQVYWFKSVADFEKHRRDVFESVNGFAVNRPVPTFELIEEAKTEPETEKAEESTTGEPDGKASVSYAEESGSTPEPVTNEESVTEPNPESQPETATAEPPKNKGGRPRKHQ